MGVYFFLFCILICIGITFAKPGVYFEDYISIEKANCLKGIFIILVFFRHFGQYVDQKASLDSYFLVIDHALGQMIVALFLFLSGYGIMESVRKKGMDYVKKMPYHRIFKVWIHFCIALIPYLIYRLAVGKQTSLKKIVLSMLCWESLGNSNWYIMAIILSYFILYLSFLIFKEKYEKAAVFATLLTCVTIAILLPFRPDRYYNTLLCVPAGVWFSLYKQRLDRFFQKSQLRYITGFMLSIIFFLLFDVLRVITKNVVVYELAAILFVSCILFFARKVCLANPVLRFCGEHVFSLYILQRLPMLFFKNVIPLSDHEYIYFAVSFLTTFLIALLFEWVLRRLDRILF